MTRRSLFVQGIFTMGAIALAFAVSSRADNTTVGEGAIILDAVRSDIDKIRFEDGDAFVELTPAHDAAGFMVNAVISARRDQVAAHGLPPAPTPERRVRGSQHTEQLFHSFAPMHAQRALGKLDDTAVAHLGFPASTKHLIVTVRGVAHRYVAAVPPAGAMDPYLRSEDDGHVYVVERLFLNAFLPGAAADHRLRVFPMDEVARVALSNGHDKRELLVGRGETQNGVSLSQVDEPHDRLIEAENWYRAWSDVEPAEILGAGETPPEGTPVLALRIDYLTSRNERLGFMEWARAGKDGTRGAAWVFARTDRSAGWMRMPRDFDYTLRGGEKLLANPTAAGNAPAPPP